MTANGYLPASELVTVQGNIQLERRTAAAFLAMREDYAEETHRNMTIAAPAGGYRPRAMQLDMRVHPAIYNITPGVIPGLPSDHGYGTEVDIGEGQAWAVVNGGRFGFTRTKLQFHDPNHYHYDGVTVAALDATRITLNRKKTRIMYLRRALTEQIALVQDGRSVIFTNPDEYKMHRTILETYNEKNPDDLQFVPPADLTKIVGLDETGWAIAVKFHGGGAAASGGVTEAAVGSIVQASEERVIAAIPKKLTGTLS